VFHRSQWRALGLGPGRGVRWHNWWFERAGFRGPG
jgi:hypothetical protein